MVPKRLTNILKNKVNLEGQLLNLAISTDLGEKRDEIVFSEAETKAKERRKSNHQGRKNIDKQQLQEGGHQSSTYTFVIESH